MRFVLEEPSVNSEGTHAQVDTETSLNDIQGENVDHPSAHVIQPSSFGDRIASRLETWATWLDSCCSAVIPVLFIMFNMAYWPWIISESEYSKELTASPWL